MEELSTKVNSKRRSYESFTLEDLLESGLENYGKIIEQVNHSKAESVASEQVSEKFSKYYMRATKSLFWRHSIQIYSGLNTTGPLISVQDAFDILIKNKIFIKKMFYREQQSTSLKHLSKFFEYMKYYTL